MSLLTTPKKPALTFREQGAHSTERVTELLNLLVLEQGFEPEAVYQGLVHSLADHMSDYVPRCEAYSLAKSLIGNIDISDFVDRVDEPPV